MGKRQFVSASTWPSSHGAYLGKDNLVRMETGPVLGPLAKSVGKARLAYLRFIAEGKAAGHQTDYYDVRDQRFLGDERFVEEIEERVQEDREIARPVPRGKLSALLPLVAKAYRATQRDLVQAGRQRKWVTARSMLVYLGRDWGRMSVKELGRRLHRDPSVISRLYSAYAAARDEKKEADLLRQLSLVGHTQFCSHWDSLGTDLRIAIADAAALTDFDTMSGP